MLTRLLFLVIFYFSLGSAHEPLPCPLSYEEDVILLPHSNEFFVKHVPIPAISEDLFRAIRFCNKALFDKQIEKSFSGLTLVFLEAPQTRSFIKHYFHLLEHVVGSWCFYAAERREEVNNILIMSDGYYHLKPWRGPHNINEHLLKALFPNATIWTPKDLVKHMNKKGVLLEKVLFSDRLASFQNPICLKTSKMLAEALPSISTDKIELMSSILRNYFNIMPTSSNLLRVTYVLRHTPPRFMALPLERNMVRKLSKISGIDIQVVDLAEISYNKQLEIISNTDILMGVHGNGLSHLLFLPQTAAIIEIFPPDAQALDYRLFADAKGIRYYGLIGNQGLKDKTWAYEHGMFGKINAEVKSVDLALLKTIIEKELLIHQEQSR